MILCDCVLLYSLPLISVSSGSAPAAAGTLGLGRRWSEQPWLQRSTAPSCSQWRSLSKPPPRSCCGTHLQNYSKAKRQRWSLWWNKRTLKTFWKEASGTDTEQFPLPVLCWINFISQSDWFLLLRLACWLYPLRHTFIKSYIHSKHDMHPRWKHVGYKCNHKNLPVNKARATPQAALMDKGDALFKMLNPAMKINSKHIRNVIGNEKEHL